ncbi:MAG TPA: lipoyl(octanoyl) transferase LipB [Usitatibacter sp.]|nr:lipoyl(octanoyl) transferase LipB [Usitatibacter sp.]
MRIRRLGRVAYEPTWRAMRSLTERRDASVEDELWLLEHPPVFTLGLAGRREHVLAPGAVPVVQTDRGGQVTYHGPGQVVAYAMVDLRRRSLGVKELVRRLEQAAIDVLAGYGIAGERRAGMPGVYVRGAKIAAVGLRVARGCTYHGLALNASLDLEPFSRIDPCGYPGLACTQMADLGVRDSIDAVQQKLSDSLERCLIPT